MGPSSHAFNTMSTNLFTYLHGVPCAGAATACQCRQPPSPGAARARLDLDLAILCRRKTHLHKSLGPTTDSFVNLSAKTAAPDFRVAVGNNLPVEQVAPSLAICRSRLMAESLLILSPSPPWLRS